MSIRRPSNTSTSGVSPPGPRTVTVGIKVIGSRRRAAAIASPSRVWAFSRTSSSSRSRSQVSRSTTGGAAALDAGVAVMAVSFVEWGSVTGTDDRAGDRHR